MCTLILLLKIEMVSDSRNAAGSEEVRSSLAGLLAHNCPSFLVSVARSE